jgi:hypothetical protein
VIVQDLSWLRERAEAEGHAGIAKQMVSSLVSPTVVAERSANANAVSNA